MNTRKRLALGAGTLTAIGAAATLIAGTTFGLFSSTVTQATGPNTFTAGKVTLTEGTSVICGVGPMSPGDGTVTPGVVNNTADSANGTEIQCKFPVNYTGNVPAYLGLDLTVTDTTAGVPAPPGDGSATPAPQKGLYNGIEAAANGSNTGLQLLVKDTAGTIIGKAAGAAGTHYGTAAAFDTNLAGPTATAPALGSSVTVSNLLLSTVPYTAASPADTITVDYFLPLGAGNGFQLAASTVKLTVHAVQSNNNPATGCTTNWVCSALTWS